MTNNASPAAAPVRVVRSCGHTFDTTADRAPAVGADIPCWSSCDAGGRIRRTVRRVDPLAARSAMFAHMVKLEAKYNDARTLAALGMYLDDRARGEEQCRRIRAELGAAMNALTVDEMRAFGEYRKAAAAADAPSGDARG